MNWLDVLKMTLYALVLAGLILSFRLRRSSSVPQPGLDETPSREHQELREECFLARLIGFVLIGQNVVFGAVAWYVLRTQHQSVEDQPGLRYSLAGITCLLVGLIPFVRNWTMRLTGRGKGLDPLSARRKIVFVQVVVLGLSEIPALLGLALAMITHRIEYFFLFAGISLAVFFLVFPRYERWQHWWEQLSRGQDH